MVNLNVLTLIGLVIYFAVNGILAGQISEEYNWSRNSIAEKLCGGFLMLLVCIGGIPVFIGAFIYGAIQAGYKWISTVLQFDVWYKYTFTKKLYNLPESKLKEVNKNGAYRWNTDSFRHKIARYWLEKVNKRNSYTFPTPKEIEYRGEGLLISKIEGGGYMGVVGNMHLIASEIYKLTRLFQLHVDESKKAN